MLDVPFAICHLEVREVKLRDFLQVRDCSALPDLVGLGQVSLLKNRSVDHARWTVAAAVLMLMVHSKRRDRVEFRSIDF